MTPREKYINGITEPAVRKWVYAEARRLLPSIGARCALTQYLFLVKAGVLKPRRPVPTFTTQIEHILLTELAGVKRITDAAQLKRGDMCFSRNANSTPGPDHVYAFHSPAPVSADPLLNFPRWAVIVDNYQVNQHSRNITASRPKTPFDYALRLP
jgi:hypothetical protein